MIQDLKFKALTHLGHFVDLSKLHSGIYTRNTPHLYSAEKTIEDLEEMFAKVPSLLLPKTFFENLSKCELTEVTLTFDLPANEKCEHDFSDGCATGWHVCKKCGETY